jgi:hypothetical protein
MKVALQCMPIWEPSHHALNSVLDLVRRARSKAKRRRVCGAQRAFRSLCSIHTLNHGFLDCVGCPLVSVAAFVESNAQENERATRAESLGAV